MLVALASGCIILFGKDPTPTIAESRLCNCHVSAYCEVLGPGVLPCLRPQLWAYFERSFRRLDLAVS
jgi:hypothetical protein